MQKFKSLVLGLITIGLFIACQPAKEGSLALISPDQSLQFQLALTEEGIPQYSVSHGIDSSVTVIEASRLGLSSSVNNYTNGFTKIEAGDVTAGKEEYEMILGKRKKQYVSYNSRTYKLTNSKGQHLNVVVRAFNEGLAFRYGIEGSGTLVVQEELTEFHLPQEGSKWIHPYDTISNWAPAYEQSYQDELEIGRKAPADKNGWSFPALFSTRDRWVLLAESGLDGSYVGMHLNDDPSGGVYRVRMPEPEEAFDSLHIKPQITLPWQSPWRVFIVDDYLGTIAESDLVYHLAKPNQVEDISWIKPGRASWSWWYYSDSPQDYDQLKEYVDLAAEMGWEYSLVDANWNYMKGGDLKELAEYAAIKGVDLLAWYNSGGPNNVVTEQPRDRMWDRATRRSEFEMLQNIGIKGIKVDFFQSDKQHIIQLYLDILEDAADFELLVNFHGCTMPRGWSRTYPNLMTMEAVRGGEVYKFGSDYPEVAPVQNTILPFTRNVIGPMDYTPVTLSDHRYPHKTTYAHELALPVIFESGILHLADRPQAYLDLPDAAVDYLKSVPAVWDETKFIDGYPGDFVIMARKSGENWYLAGLNGLEKDRVFTPDLSFLEGQSYSLQLLGDGSGSEQIETLKMEVTGSSTIEIKTLGNGGFSAVFKPSQK